VRKADDTPLLETAGGEQLVKTKHAGKNFAGTVVICELWILAVAL
jgi:hypothetical protein